MARRSNLTSVLYRAARLSNTARALSRGPAALAKRQVRRRVYRANGSFLGRLLRKGGLG